MEIIRTEELTKIYNEEKKEIIANNKVNLSIKEGEIFTLFGPNGAGKTTLVRQLIGYLQPTSGKVYINGMSTKKHLQKIKPLIGYMVQAGESSYLSHLTVEETILFVGLLRKMSKGELKNRLNYLLQTVGLEQHRKRYVHRLSYGQKQIVKFLRAIIASPKILFLDEPTEGMDPEVRWNVWNLLFELNQNYNTTIFLITHNVLESEKVTKRAGIMYGGKIISIGEKEELKNIFKEDPIKIELYFENEIPKDFSFQVKGKEILKISDRKIIIYSSKQDSIEILQTILNSYIKKIIDFKVSEVSLEDVYMKLISKINVTNSK